LQKSGGISHPHSREKRVIATFAPADYCLRTVAGLGQSMTKFPDAKTFRAGTARALLSVSILCTWSAVGSSALAGDFYAGKTINFVFGFAVGGGFGVYGRTIANHLGRFIPGNPQVVPKIMPGAGSNIAATYLYTAAARDGTTIGAIMPNAILNKLMDPDTAKNRFVPTEFNYLAGAEYGTRVCVTSYRSKVKTYDDALTHTTVLGATAAGGSTYDYAAWHKNTTGAKFEIVSGYKGTASLYLAMERGEIDGVCGVDWTALKSQQGQLLRDNRLNLIAQDGLEPEPELTARGVPQTWRYIKSDFDRKAVRLIVGFQQTFGKAYLAPPGVPPDRIATLRKAFAATLRDPAFLADAKKARIEITPKSGESVQKSVAALYSAPKELIARIKQIQTR
jgi:tripartite-type tricarboxylate transporter receptor subunit TctC